MVLAAFDDADFQSAKILATLQVDEGAARAEIEKIVGQHKATTRTHIIPTSRVKSVIETAFRLCDAVGDARVSTGHVLLALAAEGEGIGSQVLNNLGATKERVEAELAQLTEPEP
jgi:ATP-dependent Clp protease ATP-binding subunit ClpA